MPEYWDQPRIAREFGIAPNTVQSTWRNKSLASVREHVAAALATPLHAGHASEVYEALGPFGSLSRSHWNAIRAQYGLPVLAMPDAALPLPDLVVGNKPMWTERTMNRWADDTKRRAEDGALKRCSPPGRPAGISEARPRQRRVAA